MTASQDNQGAGAETPAKPTIDSVHENIRFATQYRLELIKYLMGITAALFAFTVSFRPTLTTVDFANAMWVGWGGLAVSMIGGMFHLLGWDHYYKSYRDYDWKHRESNGAVLGKEARRCINLWRRLAMVLQFCGFMVGVLAIGLFAGMNIDHSAKTSDRAIQFQQ